MQQRSFALLGLLLGTVALVFAGWGLNLKRQLEGAVFDQRRFALIEAENARLHALVAAQQKAGNKAANQARRHEIEKAVTGIRRLNFVSPVSYDILTHEGIRRTVEQKFAAQYSDEEIKNIATALSAFGLLPRDYPLKQKYIDLLGEQVAAFYDQHTHKLFMFEDASLDRAQNQIVLAHELTHALQDQNFGLLKFPLEAKNNDDRAFAASALIEGDATLVMSEFMLKNLSWAGVRDNLLEMMAQNMEEVRKAPRYLRETLLFPYLKGQQFCLALQSGDGWKGLDKAYMNPPSSTAQILHPEKYAAHEEPIPIEWSDTEVLGHKPIADNLFGEFGIRVLLTEWIDAVTAEPVATGWRGDRYLVFDNGNALVWKTIWRGDEEAANFFRAAIRYLSKRHNLAEVVPAPGADTFRFPGKTPVILVNRHTNEVVIIDATTEEWAQALAQKFGE